VNGTAAAHRPYGYSNFFVPIDHLLHVGDDNELLVVASAHDDSRWYSPRRLAPAWRTPPSHTRRRRDPHTGDR
jgi:hypothetical protein